MGSIGSGFRVVETSDPTFLADLKMVAYRLDPATLDFAEVSGNVEQLLGFALEDWHRPQFWFGRVHPQDREAARAFVADRPPGQCDHQLEYRVIDAAGQTVWVHQIIEARRKTYGEVRGVLMNITERVAREAEVTKAMILKNELFRIVAEELAPPVRAISVYGEMLERHLAAQRDDVGSDYAVGLRDGVQHLDELLVQLMRAAQNNMSVEEMSACLGTMRGRRRHG